MITDTNVRNPISLQPDGVNLWYFKIRVMLGPPVKVWNIKGLRRQVAQIRWLKRDLWSLHNFFNFKWHKLQSCTYYELYIWVTKKPAVWISYFQPVRNSPRFMKPSALNRQSSSLYSVHPSIYVNCENCEQSH